MNRQLDLKIKHLNNLIAKKTYALFSSKKYPQISNSSFWVLDFLYTNRELEVTQKDIEKALLMNRPTTSTMLRRLERKGYIVRGTCSFDARSRTVALTQKGYDYHDFECENVAALDRFFSDVLEPEDFEAFERIYEKLRNALDEP